MTIDFEKILWLATQTEEVILNVAPLIGQILGVDPVKVVSFVKWLGDATEATVAAIRVFINFPISFGAAGEGLTDADGHLCPDCPCPTEYAPIVFALKGANA